MSDQPRISYGIDLSAGRPCVVRAARGRGAPVCETLLDGRADGREELGRIQAEAADGRAVTAAAMPAHESFVRWLQTPLASPAKARKVLPSLLDIQLPFPLEQCVYEFAEFRRAPGGAIDALAVAARAQDVTARIERLREGGVDPVRLDHEGLVLWNQSVLEMPVERGALRAVAWIGPGHVSLAFGRGADFVAAHSVRLGARDLFPNHAPDAAAIRRFALRAQQVLKASLAESGDEEIQWVWTGPGAEDGARTAALQDALSDTPGLRFHVHRQPGTFLARALAAGALRPDALQCNFRRGDLAHPAEGARRARGQVRQAAAFLVAGLVLCAMNLAWRGGAAARSRGIETSIASTAQALSGMAHPPYGKEVLVTSRALEEGRAATLPFVLSFRPSLPGLLAEMLRFSAANGIALETLTLKDDFVAVTGNTDDWNRGGQLADWLRGRGFDVKAEPQDAGSDERVHFSLSGGRSP